MTAHYGPHHDRDCLAATVREARCGCPRGAWLDEMVPRAQARAELLTQLSGWAREQRIFDQGAIEAATPKLATDLTGEVARIGMKAATGALSAVWERVTAGATNLRRECDARPGWPERSTRPVPFVETEADQSGVDESETPRVVDAVTVGGVL